MYQVFETDNKGVVKGGWFDDVIDALTVFFAHGKAGTCSEVCFRKGSQLVLTLYSPHISHVLICRSGSAEHVSFFTAPETVKNIYESYKVTAADKEMYGDKPFKYYDTIMLLDAATMQIEGYNQ